MAAASTEVDVVVVGAGISGISAGHYLRTLCPNESFVILERRDNIGGTWDLNRYPGIRSDSDMITFGFSWKRWGASKIIAPREEIAAYLEEAVVEEGLGPRLRLGTEVRSAEWSSEQQRWTLTTTTGVYICRFLHLATGYYSYEAPHRPAIAGLARFAGRVVHPQQWTERDSAACHGARVAVIGSGATAATVVPALAQTADRVTMVQRSPTYFVARPSEGQPVARAVQWAAEAVLPPAWAHTVLYWHMVLKSRFDYWFARAFPGTTRWALMEAARRQLPPSFDVDTHFNPRYNPWDERICLVPDGDFFAAIRAGKVDVVTGTIKTVTETGITMDGGHEIPADVVVTATGLTLQNNFPMSTMEPFLTTDLRYVAADAMLFKSCMVSNVPNLMFTVGYSNQSWTLKADLISQRLCRTLKAMRTKAVGVVCPRRRGAEPAEGNILGLSSGYLQRSEQTMPRLGKAFPWDMQQDYISDLWRTWTWGALSDRFLETVPTVPLQARL